MQVALPSYISVWQIQPLQDKVNLITLQYIIYGTASWLTK